ncbi:lamin tail domain-containing protein [Streptomyces collinus]|uniref:lamin tail domain-containing protein n=1 Tax=Streptomyces collinus TaxID=42684 RepID=UPI0029421495|nr:lamin tail domain-containing protein [Streptomyces collinus]
MSASVRVTPLRLTAAAAVAAVAVGAVALPAAAADRPGPHWDRAQVVIGDVQYGPSRFERSNHSLNREWVEITNNGRRDVNLRGWTLSDRDGNTYTFRTYWLEGRSSVRVHTGFGRDGGADVYQDRRHSVWDRDADSATLRNDRGRLVDVTSWGGDRRDHRHFGDDDSDFRGDARGRQDERHFPGQDNDFRGQDHDRRGLDHDFRGQDHDRRGDHRD